MWTLGLVFRHPFSGRSNWRPQTAALETETDCLQLELEIAKLESDHVRPEPLSLVAFCIAHASKIFLLLVYLAGALRYCPFPPAPLFFFCLRLVACST